MRELVFLLEEPSAKAMLESVLPRLLNDKIAFRLIPFEGKQDLEKQVVRKIRAYQNPNSRFIVMRDQDSHPDCVEIKQRLMSLCMEAGKQNVCLIRIACRELEIFYLADLNAVEQALNVKGLAKQQESKKFRNPDKLGSPSKELKLLTKNRYEKIAGSRIIGKYLELDNARSHSFGHLISGIRRMQQELLELSL